MSSLLVIFVWGVKQYCRFWIWSETEYKTPAEYGLQHNSTPSQPHSHTLSVYTVNLVWERGGGGQIEDRGATVHKYSSFVHGGNSSEAGRNTNHHEWMYLQSIKSVKHNAAKFVERSILKKSRHMRFGVFIVQSSMLQSKKIQNI